MPQDIKLTLDPTANAQEMREIVATIAARRKDVLESASNNLRKAHLKMKNRHDKTAKEHDFEIGDYCYLFVPSLLVPNTSKKMQNQYAGPYIITKFTTKYTCQLMRCQDGKMPKRPVHVQRLRKPRVRDKNFLKRLPMGPTHTLLDPDQIIKAKLSHRDTALIRAGVGTHKNHSKAATVDINKIGSQVNVGAMFNAKHQEWALKQQDTG